MNKLYLLIIIMMNISFLSFEGCSSSQSTTSGSDNEEKVDALPSERLINKLEANRRKIKNFDGSGTIVIKSDQFDNSATFRTIIQKPDTMNLTIMGPFNIDVAKILVTKDKFKFYDVLQNTVYNGDVDENILKNIFKIDLPLSSIVDAFTGSVNLTQNLYHSPDKYDVIYDTYVLTYIDKETGYSSIYKVDVKGLNIKEYNLLDKDGNLILKCKYSKFNDIQDTSVPYRIEVENVKENQNVTIEYRKININKSNLQVDFKVPNDVQMIEW